MKTTNRSNAPSAFTLVELLVVIALIAIVAGLAIPASSGTCKRGMQTKALSNAKQIALALRLYASDNAGKYPSFTLQDGKSTAIPVSNSNDAFAQLFPTYIQQEAIFWVAKSAFCSASLPDEKQDPAGAYPPVLTLASGQNEWAYVLGLNDASNPSVPLVASGFNNPVTHTYSTDPTQKGGVWKGQKAIVIHSDSSGIIANVDQASMKVLGPNGTLEVLGPNGASSVSTGDIFTTANAANGWLQPANVVVNPK